MLMSVFVVTDMLAFTSGSTIMKQAVKTVSPSFSS